MSFNSFWKWLCLQGRVIRNLGDEAEFGIYAMNLTGEITPLASKNKFAFTIRDAKSVWDRYHSLSKAQQFTPKLYCPPDWTDCKCQPRGPWIAAAIRDFEIGQSKL
jgi:hypothetical protein